MSATEQLVFPPHKSRCSSAGRRAAAARREEATGNAAKIEVVA